MKKMLVIALTIVILIGGSLYFYQMGRGVLLERTMTFMPQNFVYDLLSIDKLFFVGNLVFPYVYVALLLSVVYILIIRVGIRLWMRHYYLQ